jgi:hypothetical protein
MLFELVVRLARKGLCWHRESDAHLALHRHTTDLVTPVIKWTV